MKDWAISRDSARDTNVLSKAPNDYQWAAHAADGIVYSLKISGNRGYRGTIAELEAATTGERITLVNEYKVKSGMPLQGTRCMPFCYAVESREGEKAKYIVKRNEEAMKELLAHVFLNKSIRGAQKYINKKFGLRLRYQAVQNVLTNEMICGSYRGNPNYCPPYLSRADFERLQVLIARSPRTSENEHTYIFTGLLKCPHCGRNLNGGLHVTNRGDKSYRYYNYRCPKHRASHLCDFNMAIFENTLEKMLLDEIEGIIGKKKASISSIKAKGERISKYDVDELQAELDRLNYSWQKGRIKSVEEYDRKYDDLVAKIEEASNEQAAIDAEPDYEKIQKVLTSGWKDIYKKLDGEHKRAFWREFIREIHIEWTPYKKKIKNIDFF